VIVTFRTRNCILTYSISLTEIRARPSSTALWQMRSFHTLSSNSKCNTASPDGLRCCHDNEMPPTNECRRT
jgi:hypothetical protein